MFWHNILQQVSEDRVQNKVTELHERSTKLFKFGQGPAVLSWQTIAATEKNKKNLSNEKEKLVLAPRRYLFKGPSLSLENSRILTQFAPGTTNLKIWNWNKFFVHRACTDSFTFLCDRQTSHVPLTIAQGLTIVCHCWLVYEDDIMGNTVIITPCHFSTAWLNIGVYTNFGLDPCENILKSL